MFYNFSPPLTFSPQNITVLLTRRVPSPSTFPPHTSPPPPPTLHQRLFFYLLSPSIFPSFPLQASTFPTTRGSSPHFLPLLPSPPSFTFTSGHHQRIFPSASPYPFTSNPSPHFHFKPPPSHQRLLPFPQLYRFTPRFPSLPLTLHAPLPFALPLHPLFPLPSPFFPTSK